MYRFKLPLKLRLLFNKRLHSSLDKKLNGALACYLSGKHNLAIKMLDEILKLNPSNIIALILNSKCFAKKNKPYEALELLEKIHLDVLPRREKVNLTDAYNLVAEAFIEKEDYFQAENILKKSIELYTKNYTSKLLLANIFAKQNKFEKTIRLFEICADAKKIRKLSDINSYLEALEKTNKTKQIKKILDKFENKLNTNNFTPKELAEFWLNRQNYNKALNLLMESLKDLDKNEVAITQILIYICEKELGIQINKDDIKKEISLTIKKLSFVEREETLLSIVEICKKYNQQSLAWVLIKSFIPPKVSTGKLLLAATTLARNYGNFQLAEEWLKLGIRLKNSEIQFSKIKTLLDGEKNVAKNNYRPKVEWNLPSNWAPKKMHVMHVLEKSLPYKNDGYCLRSHGMLKAQQKMDYVVSAVTRPGFPRDLGRDNRSHSAVYNSVLYYRIKADGEAHYFNRPLDQYLDAYAHRLLQICIREKPEIIQAVSNFKNAFATKAVADCLNIPWAYEIRGLWEEEQVSKRVISAHSERFEYARNMEDEALNAANVVITTSNTMRTHLMDRSVPANKIFVVPHAVDSSRFIPTVKNPELFKKHDINKDSFVFGYIGKLNRYEGIHTLLDACNIVKNSGINDFTCLIIGSGKDFERIQRITRQLNLEDNVRIIPSVAHAVVNEYYNLLDLFVLPRTADPICQIETPKKPFEAMSIEVPLLLSGTKALREILKNCECGEFVEPENIEVLAQKIIEFKNNPEKLKVYGKNAREYIINERSWSKVSENYQIAYNVALENKVRKAA